MAAQTTTIRVPVHTRDRLATQARERGDSITTLLTELALALILGIDSEHLPGD